MKEEDRIGGRNRAVYLDEVVARYGTEPATVKLKHSHWYEIPDQKADPVVVWAAAFRSASIRGATPNHYGGPAERCEALKEENIGDG